MKLNGGSIKKCRSGLTSNEKECSFEGKKDRIDGFDHEGIGKAGHRAHNV